jgi:hypothetical protein
MDANQRKMDVETRSNREKMAARLESKTEAKNQKFGVLRSTLVSRMGIHQSRTEVMQEKPDANLRETRAGQEHPQTRMGCLTPHTDVNEEKVDARLENMKACQSLRPSCRPLSEA